jgi:hypothetical protein
MHLSSSRINDSEMASIMSDAVDHVYALPLLKQENPEKYGSEVQFGERYTTNWKEPSTKRRR